MEKAGLRCKTISHLSKEQRVAVHKKLVFEYISQCNYIFTERLEQADAVSQESKKDDFNKLQKKNVKG